MPKVYKPFGPVGQMRLLALIVASATFMQSLDSTIVATALPAMSHSFGVSAVALNVALTSYMFGLAAFIPASGWVANRFGTRTTFQSAILVFTVGSVLCGRADSLIFLVLARILQGIGGSMMLPVGRLILLNSVERDQYVSAMSWLSVPALLGPILGPPIGGFIVTYFQWHWIFDINVPVGLAGIAAAAFFIEEQKSDRPGRFDIQGFLLTGFALLAVIFGASTLDFKDLPLWFPPVSVFIGLVLFGIYILYSKVSYKKNILDLGLFKFKDFRTAVTAGSVFRFGAGAIPFLLPLLLQIDFGQTAFQSGLITLGSAVGAIAMKFMVKPILERFGFREILIKNALLSGCCILAYAFFRPSWPIAAIYVVLILGGLARSLQFTAYNTVAYGTIPKERMSDATTLYTTGQQVSITLGIAIGAGVLTVSQIIFHDPLPTLTDFSIAFIVIALITFAASPLSLAFDKNSGQELLSRAKKKS